MGRVGPCPPGASVVLAARYIPIGRVAVNVSAGAVGYSRRRFVGIDAIAALTWALYAVSIGIGAGEWFKGHPLRAIVVGVVGGVLIGLVLDWVIGRLAYRSNWAVGPINPASIHTPPGAGTRRHRK